MQTTANVRLFFFFTKNRGQFFHILMQSMNLAEELTMRIKTISVDTALIMINDLLKSWLFEVPHLIIDST